jgi:hypothetical protein
VNQKRFTESAIKLQYVQHSDHEHYVTWSQRPNQEVNYKNQRTAHIQHYTQMQHKNGGNIKLQNRRTHLTPRMNNTEYNGTRQKLSTKKNAGTLGS